MSREDYLFVKHDAYAVREHQLASAKAEIAAFDGNRLLNTNDEDLVAYFVEKYRIDVPVLDEANAVVDQKEASRDVSGDPRRIAYHLNHGPVHVTGDAVQRRFQTVRN